MARPNFDDPAERRAYNRELKALSRPWRWLGILLILAGVAVVLLRGQGFDPLSLMLVAAGWVVFIAVIIKRGRYHRLRMAEPAPTHSVGGRDAGGQSPK